MNPKAPQFERYWRNVIAGEIESMRATVPAVDAGLRTIASMVRRHRVSR